MKDKQLLEEHIRGLLCQYQKDSGLRVDHVFIHQKKGVLEKVFIDAVDPESGKGEYGH